MLLEGEGILFEIRTMSQWPETGYLKRDRENINNEDMSFALIH